MDRGEQNDDLYNAGIPIFNKHGTYLTRKEREDMARRKGLCEKCGIMTVKGRIRRTNITDVTAGVYKGVCIKCFPSKVPVNVVQEYEIRNPRQAKPAARQGSLAAKPTSKPSRSASSPTPLAPARMTSAPSRSASQGTQRSLNASSHAGRSLNISSHGRGLNTSTHGRSLNASTHGRSLNASSHGLSLNASTHGRSGNLSLSGSGYDQADGSKSLLRNSRSSSRVTGESTLIGLKKNLKNPDLLLKYLHQIRDNGGDFDDFIEDIFEIMDLYKSYTNIMAITCSGIWRLVLDTNQKIKAAESGLLETILETIRKENFEDVDFIECAIGTVTSIAQVSENKIFFANKGGIEIVIDALINIPASSGVFEWTCRCLYTLVCESEDETVLENIVAIHEVDGLAVITTAIGHHFRDPIPLRWALKLLWCLQDISDDKALGHAYGRMIDADFAGVAVKVLKCSATMSSPDLCFMTLELLCVLLQSSSYDESMEMYDNASKCIRALVRMMEKEFSANCKVLEVCCRFLAILACNSSNARHLLQEFDGPQAILEALEEFGDNSTLAESATWVLWAMSSGDLFFRDTELLQRTCKITSMVAKKHNSPAFLHPLCGYWGNVCGRFNIDSAIIPLTYLINALEVLEDNPVCLKEAHRALGNIFATFPDLIQPNRASFEKEPVVNSFVELVKSPSCYNKSSLSLLSMIVSKSELVRKAIATQDSLKYLMAKLDDQSYASLQMHIMELMALLVGSKIRSISIPKNSMDIIIGLVRTYNTASQVEKICILIRNLILVLSSRPDMEQLVDCITQIINFESSTVNLKMEACGVLWALSAKFPKQPPETVEQMYDSVVAAVMTHKDPYHADLQKVAVGALCCITASAKSVGARFKTDQLDDIVSLPYTVLDYDPDSIEQFEMLLEVILNLSYLDEYAIVQGGVIVVVIDTMAEFEQNSAIQETGCAILGLLSSTENLQINLSIVQTDGIDMIMNALGLFAGNIKVEKQACKALSHLSIDQESRILISSLGGIMLLGNTIRTNIKDLDLLEGCCTALLNLSSDADDALLLGCNIIETIVEVMNYHLDESSIQESSMGVLQNVSMRSNEMKEAIADAGGISSVTTAIKEHMCTPSVLERAFTTLWSLAVLDSNQPVIADADGISLVVNGMLAGVSSENVQKQGCGCLCTLSSNSYNKGAIQNVGGVDSIVYAMWVHYGSEDIQTEACRALSSLAVDVHTNEVMIASEGEVNAIVSAMRRFPDSERLQEHACVALRNFLLSADNVDVFRASAAEVIDAVTYAAEEFPDSCTERANQVLSSLN